MYVHTGSTSLCITTLNYPRNGQHVHLEKENAPLAFSNMYFLIIVILEHIAYAIRKDFPKNYFHHHSDHCTNIGWFALGLQGILVSLKINNKSLSADTSQLVTLHAKRFLLMVELYMR